MDNKFKKLGNFIKKHKDGVIVDVDLAILEQQMMFNEMLDKDPKLRKRIESVLKSHKTKKES